MSPAGGSRAIVVPGALVSRFADFFLAMAVTSVVDVNPPRVPSLVDDYAGALDHRRELCRFRFHEVEEVLRTALHDGRAA